MIALNEMVPIAWLNRCGMSKLTRRVTCRGVPVAIIGVMGSGIGYVEYGERPTGFHMKYQAAYWSAPLDQCPAYIRRFSYHSVVVRTRLRKNHYGRRLCTQVHTFTHSEGPHSDCLNVVFHSIAESSAPISQQIEWYIPSLGKTS